jgi:Helicase conserved C-terminal domain
MKFERIDGSITGHSRQMAIDRYQSSDSADPPFVMLLSTRAGGVGINLTAADTCIIFDSDFNPQNDLQAQARCHRIGQEKKVQVYRLLSSRTYEMQMFHMSSLKMGLDQVVLKGFENGASADGGLSKEEVEKLLRHGAYDILNEDKDGKSEETTNDFIQADIDAILERRSRTVVHDGPGASAAGGTFSKASFKVAKSPDGSQGPSSREDVDIEDPDFWKKMLGEKHFQEDVHGTVKGTRKRTKADYREPKYTELEVTHDMSGGSDSDSESSFDSDYNNNNNNGERSRWGGSLPQHWKKDQVERLIQVLLAFGYRNLPWKDFQQRVNGISEKSELEVR